MNHKRKRPKNRRAGCLMCKPWKMNGWGNKKDCFGRKPGRLAHKDIDERLSDMEEVEDETCVICKVHEVCYRFPVCADECWEN